MSSRITRPLLAAVLLSICAGVHAQVVISEFRTRGPAGGNDEFVEIHNIGAAPADISGWKINGSNAAGTTGTRATIPASTTLGAGCSYLLANNSASGYSGATSANQTYNTGITDDGGIAVLNAANAIQDAAGMNAAATMLYKEGTPLVPLVGTADQAYERKPGGNAGHAVDTNNNATDFARIAPSSPRNLASPCIVADAAPTVSSTVPTDAASGIALDADIVITFSEAVTVDTPSFTLDCPTGAAQAFGFSGSGTATITLNPAADLPAGVTCEVDIIATQVADIDDTPTNMVGNYEFRFSTQAAAPVVTLAAAAVTQAEGDGGTTNAVFTVNITPAPAGTVSFDATVTGSGIHPADATDFAAGVFGNAVAVSFDATSTPPYQVIVPIAGDTSIEPDETFTLTLDNFAGTDAAQASPLDATGTIQNDDLPVSAIHDIQGAGPFSPIVTDPNPADGTIAGGVQVKVVGAVVTAVTKVVGVDGSPADQNGFFMQAQDADADASRLTSEGILVFTGSAPTVNVGDVVTVVGQAQERFSQTQIATNVAGGTVLVTGTATLPTAVEFSATSGIPSTDPAALSCPGTGPGTGDNAHTNFECFEGMRVWMPQAVVSAANQRRATDLFAEVHITPYGERSRREPGLVFPLQPEAGNAAAGQWDGNPEVLEMDADEAGLPLLELTAGSSFAATGVIGYSFGDYEFYPTAYTPDFVQAVTEAVAPSAGGDELTVASFNVQHLCDDPNDDDCTRDTPVTGGAYSYTDKLRKLSAYVRTVLNSPDVIGVQEVDEVTSLADLATRIATDGGPSYAAHLLEGDDVGGIDVGFLVRTDRVQGADVQQFYKGQQWPDPNGLQVLHDRPPLLLRATFTAPGGNHPIAVLNNHTKSIGNVDASGTAAERDRAKRFRQGLDIATLVQQFQTATGPFAGQGTDEIPLVLVGDYNAFEFSDGHVDVVGLIAGTYDDDANECNAVLSGGAGVETCNLGGPNLVDPPLYDSARAVPPAQRASYLFTQDFNAVQGSEDRDVPSTQAIDHILLARTAQGFYAGTDFGIGNNVASAETNRQHPPAEPAPSNAIRASDHDGVVAYLDFDCRNNPALNPDGDIVCGMLDNCPNAANDDQADGDGDDIGDACDTNTVPLAFDDAASVAEGGSVSVLTGNATSVKANDSDVEDGVPAGDATLVAGPAHASAFTLAADGTFSYTHDGSEGATPDSFTYSVADSSGASSNVATVNITIAAANDAPTISDVDDVSTGQNQAITVDFTIADADSAVTCADVSASSDTQAVIADAGIVVSGTAQACSATLTPVTDAAGTSSITLTVSDGTATASDSFVLKVKAQNNAPAFSNEPYAFDLVQNADAGTTVGTVTATDADDGDALAFSITAQDRAGALAIDPQSGVITVADASQMFAGTFGLTVRVTDAAGDSDTAAVTITVAALPDAIFADGFED